MMMMTEAVGFGFALGGADGVGCGVDGTDVGITPGPVLEVELHATVVPSAPSATNTNKA